MSTYTTLRVIQDGNVLTAYLNRPESRNAISMLMVNELSELMDEVEVANDIAVFVLRGSPDVFTTGIDLRDFAVDKRRDIYGLQKWEQMARQLENLNKFTVAAVQGECTGGGVQLVLLCDARIAEKHATFCMNEVKLGFLPGMATYRMAKYIGLGRAKHLVLTGDKFSARSAHEWGLLDGVCDSAEFEDALRQTIDRLLPFHPEALQLARRLLLESYAGKYEDFLGHFLAAQHRAVNSEAFGRLVAKAVGSDHPAV
jgi:enoyl-CoA hydratase/carnithine racemase